MSDSDASPPQSAGSDTSASTPFDGLPGIIFAQVHIKNPDITEELMEEWHREHFGDLVNCPGNGGHLCLRYRNLNPSYSAYDNPKLEDRPGKPAEATRKEIANFNWQNLSLVQIHDLSWVKSTPFLSLPFTSKVLPRKEDGSWGNVWDATFPALRTYRTVDRIRKQGVEAGHSKYMVLVQLDTLDNESAAALEKIYGERASCRSTTKFDIAPGLMQFQEHGSLPEGILVFEFDEEPALAREEELKGVQIVRQDAWELFAQRSDSSLVL